jgi:hypothetical protein
MLTSDAFAQSHTIDVLVWPSHIAIQRKIEDGFHTGSPIQLVRFPQDTDQGRGNKVRDGGKDHFC